MSALQLLVSGSQSDVTGISQVTASDPAQINSLNFYISKINRGRVGPLPADRVLSGGLYEKDVLLDAKELTRVQAEAVLSDGSVVLSEVATFGTRFEPLSAAPGILTSIAVTPQPSQLNITATRGSAFIWKCYCKCGAQPTISPNANPAAVGDPLDEQFLRFNESELNPADPHLSFSMAAVPGTWNVIALGFNSAGQQGARRAVTVQVNP